MIGSSSDGLWRNTTLGEIGRYVNGRGFKKSEWSDRGRMIVRIQDLTGTGSSPNYFDGQCDDKHVVREGDVLISWAATLDAFIWQGPEAVLNQHIFKVESAVDRRFHFHLVKYVLEDIRRRAHGSGMVHITKGAFEQTPVRIPQSREMQAAIADAIDQQLSRLQAAEGDVRRVLPSIATLRSAVAAAATSGKLVPLEAELGTPYEPAVEFVRRMAAEIPSRRHRRNGRVDDHSPKTLPPGWAWAPLRELGQLDRGRSRHRPRNDPALYGGRYPFIQTGDIRRSDGTIRSHTQSYNEAGLAQSRLWPSGTLCVTIAANIAETAVLTYPACFPDSVAGFVHPGEPATTRYVQLCLLAVKQRLWELAPATAQKNINLETLDAIVIPVPPLQEQRRIVQEADRLMSLAQSVEASVVATLKRSNHLRESLVSALIRQPSPAFE